MASIAIAICTLNRPEGLSRLLDAVARQRLSRIEARDVCVVVVDNSPEGSMATLVARRSEDYPFALACRHEPARGLAHARNAALDAAAERGAAVLVFIDDDEVPSPAWLEALVLPLVAGQADADAVLGPVWPLFETPPSRWLPVEAYATRPAPEGGRTIAGYTGNVAIRMAAVSALGLRFDTRLNTSGGEDTAFFRAWMAGGRTLTYAPDAVAWEAVPRARASVGWLLRRWSRTGAVEAQLAAFERPGLGTAVKNFGKGMLRLVGGTARIMVTAVALPLRGGRHSDLTAGAYTLCRGAGYVAGAFGRTQREYAPRALESADQRVDDPLALRRQTSDSGNWHGSPHRVNATRS